MNVSLQAKWCAIKQSGKKQQLFCLSHVYAHCTEMKLKAKCIYLAAVKSCSWLIDAGHRARIISAKWVMIIMLGLHTSHCHPDNTKAAGSTFLLTSARSFTNAEAVAAYKWWRKTVGLLGLWRRLTVEDPIIQMPASLYFNCVSHHRQWGYTGVHLGTPFGLIVLSLDPITAGEHGPADSPC